MTEDDNITGAPAAVGPADTAAGVSRGVAVGSSTPVDLRGQLVDAVTESLKAGEADAVSALESLANFAVRELAAAAADLPTEDLASELTALLAADPTLRGLLGSSDGDS